MRRLHLVVLMPLAVALSACDMVVLRPAGDVALRQRDLLLISTGLMLLIIVPVIALTVVFAWYYRKSNKSADYAPDWDHSTQLELVIWAAPLMIVMALGALTWMGTHILDPYRPLDRISASKPFDRDVKALKVNVVALDWKWLFIYPDYGIATVNELAAPIDRPIDFHLTSANVMNSFYIPALAGQIYTMPRMETQLKSVINKPGVFEGFSANYSGAGFSGMRFSFHGLSDEDFDAWIASAKSGGALDRAAYLKLELPSENVPVARFGSVDPMLFMLILSGCVDPAKPCPGPAHHQSGS